MAGACVGVGVCAPRSLVAPPALRQSTKVFPPPRLSRYTGIVPIPEAKEPCKKKSPIPEAKEPYSRGKRGSVEIL